MKRAAIPRGPDELTAAWLGAGLHRSGLVPDARVAGFRVEELGAGSGFIGQILRVHLEYGGPAPGAPQTLIAKFPIPLERNRGLGELLNVYEREIRFYAELADRVALPTPRCYWSALDPSPLTGREAAVERLLERLPEPVVRGLVAWTLRFGTRRGRRRSVLCLEDLAPARVGDQVAGCSAATAERALRALAVHHAALWDDDSLDSLHWVPRVDALARFSHVLFRRSRRVFFESYGDQLPAWLPALAEWLDARGSAVLSRLGSRPRTLLHGDYRLDNLFFSDDGTVTAVDWQVVSRGRAGWDVAYFISGNLEPEVAARAEPALLEAYLGELRARGVRDYELPALRRDCELAKLALVYRFIAGADLIDLAGERGERLLDSSLQRLFARLPRGDLDALLA